MAYGGGTFVAVLLHLCPVNDPEPKPSNLYEPRPERLPAPLRGNS